MCHNNDLQCKLDTVVRNSNEQKQCTNVQIDKMNCIIRNLQADMCTKHKVIRELEEQLCNEKKQHKAEIECSQKIRLKLENLKLQQKMMPPKYNQCTSKINDNYQVTDNVSKILEELNLDYEAPTCFNNEDIADESMNNGVKEFEKFCLKLDSVVNYLHE